MAARHHLIGLKTFKNLKIRNSKFDCRRSVDQCEKEETSFISLRKAGKEGRSWLGGEVRGDTVCFNDHEQLSNLTKGDTW